MIVYYGHINEVCDTCSYIFVFEFLLCVIITYNVMQVDIEMGDYFFDPTQWVNCRCNLYDKGLEAIETIKKIFGKSSRDIKWKDFFKYCVSDILKVDSQGLSWALALFTTFSFDK